MRAHRRLKIDHPWDAIFGLAVLAFLGPILVLIIPALIMLGISAILAGVRPAFLIKGGRR